MSLTYKMLDYDRELTREFWPDFDAAADLPGPAPIAPPAPARQPAAPQAEQPAESDRPRNLIQVIEFCRRHSLPAEVVGRWVWLRFDSKPSAETRDLLKAAGFRWVNIRKAWAHNCGHFSRHGVGDPRSKYGAIPVDQLA